MVLLGERLCGSKVQAREPDLICGLVWFLSFSEEATS